MVLSKKQESVIIDILSFAPETWIPAITLQARSIPEDNRVEFGQRLLSRISACQVKVQHAASILRRGPNLDPGENPKAFSLMHADYLSRLFIAHRTLCERLCDNLVKQTHNHGWKHKVDRWREIESNKFKMKDHIADEIHRAPRSETDDRFSLLEIMDAMEYVGQNPTVCRKMLDLWPEYGVFQEYGLVAWMVIVEEVELEDRMEEGGAIFPREGMGVESAKQSTRITRSSHRPRTIAVESSSRCSSNQMKKRCRRITRGKNDEEDKEDESNNGDTENNEETEPAAKNARHRHRHRHLDIDLSLNLHPPLQSVGMDAMPNPNADGTLDPNFDFIPQKKLLAVVVPYRDGMNRPAHENKIKTVTSESWNSPSPPSPMARAEGRIHVGAQPSKSTTREKGPNSKKGVARTANSSLSRGKIPRRAAGAPSPSPSPSLAVPVQVQVQVQVHTRVLRQDRRKSWKSRENLFVDLE